MNSYKLPIVVNIYKSKYDVYCGRGSIYGNPFKIDTNGNTREVVISKFKKYFEEKIKTNEWTIEKLFEDLGGKRIGCFCKPQNCHLDIIINYMKEHLEKYNDYT